MDRIEELMALFAQDGRLAHDEIDKLFTEIERLRRENTGLGVRVQQGWKRIEDLEEVTRRLLDGWLPCHSVRRDKPHNWERTQAMTHKVTREPITKGELAIVRPECSLDWPCACGIGRGVDDA